VKIVPDPRNTYRAEVEAFSQAILNGGPTPKDAELGLRSQQLLGACYESARTGQAVAIGP
jgi:predicted dehydrogenase